LPQLSFDPLGTVPWIRISSNIPTVPYGSRIIKKVEVDEVDCLVRARETLMVAPSGNLFSFMREISWNAPSYRVGSCSHPSSALTARLTQYFVWILKYPTVGNTEIMSYQERKYMYFDRFPMIAVSDGNALTGVKIEPVDVSKVITRRFLPSSSSKKQREMDSNAP
jgi:hypothetical protein